MNEEVLYSDDNIKVTSERVRVGDKSYLLAELESVTVSEHPLKRVEHPHIGRISFAPQQLQTLFYFVLAAFAIALMAGAVSIFQFVRHFDDFLNGLPLGNQDVDIPHRIAAVCAMAGVLLALILLIAGNKTLAGRFIAAGAVAVFAFLLFDLLEIKLPGLLGMNITILVSAACMLAAVILMRSGKGGYAFSLQLKGPFGTTDAITSTSYRYARKLQSIITEALVLRRSSSDGRPGQPLVG